jgi:hypothetical protein
MGIQVIHQPAAALVAGAAYAAGAGTYAKWLAEQEARERELLQRDAAQQRQIVANFYGDELQRQAEVARLRANQEFQIGRDRMQHAWEVSDRQAEQDWKAKQAGIEFEREADLRRELAAPSNEWHRTQGELTLQNQLTAFADRFRDNLAAKQRAGFVLRPQDQAKLDGLFEKRAKVVADNSLTGSERIMAIGQVHRQIEQFLEALPPGEPPKPFAQRVADGDVDFVEQPWRAEDGTVVGTKVVREETRNGQRMQRVEYHPFPADVLKRAAGQKFDPEKYRDWAFQNETKLQGVPEEERMRRFIAEQSVGVEYAGLTNNEVLNRIEQQKANHARVRDEAIRRLENYRRENPAGAVALEAQMRAIGQAPWAAFLSDEAQPPPPPPPAEAPPGLGASGPYAGLPADEAAFVEAQGATPSASPLAAPPITPVADPPVASAAAVPPAEPAPAIPPPSFQPPDGKWTREAIDQRLRELNPEVVDDPTPEEREFLSRLTPERVAEIQSMDPTQPDPVIAAAAFISLEMAREQEQKERDTATPVKAEDLPAKVRSQLPRPQTKAEIAALRKQYGPGIEFEWIDGSVLRTK